MGVRRGVFVGVNYCPGESRIQPQRYAEADATAMHRMLTDEVAGAFAADDCVLLVGAAATATAVKRALLDSRDSDVLFIYVAGPGMDTGLGMDFLRRDVLDRRAGAAILMLDIVPATGEVDLRPPGRFGALLARTRDGRTRERDDLGHGVFTHHVLRGLAGDAAAPDGDVTFERLGAFVAQQDLHPPPAFQVDSRAMATVLTRPGQRADRVRVVPCANPLDPYVTPLTLLLERAFRQRRWPAPADPLARLDLLRFAVDAEAGAVVSFAPESDRPYRVEAVAGPFGVDESGDLLRELAARITSTPRPSLGYVCAAGPGPSTLVVPLSHETTGQLTYALLRRPDRAFVDLDEPLATALGALWRLDPAENALAAEFAVLTALRVAFGRLPIGLYHYGLTAYDQLIGSLSMVFEPVMSLGPRLHAVSVYGWEALARRREGDARAPVELLEAAHDWGDEFVVERDRLLAIKALGSYVYAHANSDYRIVAPAPLSINVAVRSLVNDAYADAVHAAIDDTGLRHKVTLEISERDPIEPWPDEVWPPSPIEYFRRRLSTLAERLGVSFAVDDFGVGHASLDRLSSLALAHIKVDRAILHHPLALDEISLVVGIARDAVRRGATLTARSVVIEGFDDESPVSLRDIYGRGVRYVQGYITEQPASSTLMPLSDELRGRIARQVRDSA